MHFLKKFYFLALVLFSFTLFYACSSSKNAETGNAKIISQKSQSTPWYENQKGFSKDSLSFYSIASSISTDSMRAVVKARKLATAQLDNGMQAELENIRVQIVKEDGQNASAGKPGFIWLMRGATLHHLKNIKEVKSTVKAKNGIYQAYVKLEYSKNALMNDLLQSLAGNKPYLDEVKNSNAYNMWMENKAGNGTVEKTAN